MEEMAMAPKLLHISSTAGTKILSPISPYASMLMPTMWNFSWLKKPYLDVTEVLLIYIEKLVFRNSDSNKEAIRKHSQLGSDGEAMGEST